VDTTNFDLPCLYRPKFRSYRPLDDTLKDNKIEDAKPGNIEDQVKDQLQSANTKVILDELVSTIG